MPRIVNSVISENGAHAALTLNVFGRGAADISIGPLFVSIGNDHGMWIDAKNVAKHLVVEENHVIGHLITMTPIPGIMCVEGYTSGPASGLDTNQGG
jgi:hypothetical protein